MSVGCAVTPTIAGRNCGEDSVRELEGEYIERRYVKNAEISRDHTGTIPSAEEARGVAAYSRVASVDLVGRAIGFTRPAYTWVSQPLLVCTVSPPQSPRLYARNCDVTALGLLSTYLSVG